MSVENLSVNEQPEEPEINETAEPTPEMDEIQADEPPRPLDFPELLQALDSPEEDDQLAALDSLATIKVSNLEIVRTLEKVAVHDPSDRLRTAALEALTAPAHQGIQARHSRLAVYNRKIIHTEIERWEQDNIISAEQATVLRTRYPVATTTAAKAAKKERRERPRSLKELLLSEAAVQTALYLGAFFVIAAAFIFALALEAARGPILTLVAGAGFGTAVVLFKRLRQASFVFFTIGSTLIPITAGVLIDQVGFLDRLSDPVWMAVWVVLALVWIIGTYFYRSKLFSMLALWSATTAAFMLGETVDISEYLHLLLVAVVTLFGLGGAHLLRHWRGIKLFWPLFAAVQLQEAALLLFSAVIVTGSSPAGNLAGRLWWLVLAVIWLMGTGFYTFSFAITKFELFPLVAVIALLPVPLFALGIFNPGVRTVAIVAWVWGAILAASGLGIAKSKRKFIHTYWFWLLGSSAAVFILAAILGLNELLGLGIGILLGVSVVYLLLTIWQRRTFTWTGALVATLGAYLAIFGTKPIQRLEIPYEFVFLFPGILHLMGELAVRKSRSISARWIWPVRILGLLALGASGAFALVNGLNTPWNSVITFSIIAFFAAVYALWDGRTLIGVITTAALAGAIPYIVSGLNWDHWLILVYGLASLYWLGSLVLNLIGKRLEWSNLLRVSGLVLGTVGAFTAPAQGGALSIFGTAVIASFFVVEGLRLKNVWLGFPANLLYLGAYFMALLELDISEPQFFSIGAALLGIVMHYLLVRGKNYFAAGFTGVIAQLILLSTTYIQMVSNDEFIYFFVIFLQSLVLLVYGLIVRARSFVITPIIFVVVSVITVAFSVLSGMATILMIGCTGTILLGLGVLALLMRPRISQATAELGEKLGGWRG
jgi:hypothetical protein